MCASICEKNDAISFSVWRKTTFIVVTLLCSLVLTLLMLEFAIRVYRWHVVNLHVKNVERIAQNTNIILSFGESTTYGLWSGKNKNYSALLEKTLNNNTRSITYNVINLGFCGAISDDIVECFTETMRFYKAHTVLLCMGVNDFSYMLNYRKRGIQKKGIHPFEFKRKLIGARSGPRPVLWDLLLKIRFYLDKSENWVTVEDREGNTHVNYYKPDDRTAQFPVPIIEDIVSHLKQNYEIMIDYCRQNHIRFYLVNYLVAGVNPLLADIARENNTFFVDVSIRDSKEIQDYTFDDLFHPNHKGHSLISDRIMQRFTETGFFEKDNHQ